MLSKLKHKTTNNNVHQSPETVNEDGVKREDVVSIFQKYDQVIPLPLDSRHNPRKTPSEMNDTISGDLKAFGFRDLKTFEDLIASKSSGDPLDDKTLLMERIIQLITALPPDSQQRTNLTDKFCASLVRENISPTYQSDCYRYRSADGSHNNPVLPGMGAAKSAYARLTNRPTTQPGGLPDPGLIFDSLFAREAFVPHSNKVSSLFSAWAMLIANDTFQTDPKDSSISQTSSHLDLSILYGNNEHEQVQMRTFQFGRIKPDRFSNVKVATMSPAAGVLLVMLNRFHNYVVERLAALNENNRFAKPPEGLSSEEAQNAWMKHDNDLFQTGRLITCGLYISITLFDFLRTMTNLNRSNSTWNLDPRHIPKRDLAPAASGNQSMVELSFIYHWHSMASERNDGQMKSIDREPVGDEGNSDPSKRAFTQLQRQENGCLRDEDLIQILSSSIEEPAGAYGAFNTPADFRDLDIHNIRQARQWNVGSLNDFRRSLGLEPYGSFEEITSEPEISDILHHLYDHPDFVELYPGIIAEGASSGSTKGFAISGTVLHAILSHITTTVRGDRFYNSDYNPKSLTNWGYSEVQRDLNINQGCTFYRLVQRAFPFRLKPDSIYAHFPMTIPSENNKIMRTLGRKHDYSYDSPRCGRQPVHLADHPNILMIVDSPNFNLVHFEITGSLFSRGVSNYLHLGSVTSSAEQRDASPKFPHSDEWHRAVSQFYLHLATESLMKNPHTVAGVGQANIAELAIFAHVYFASKVLPFPIKIRHDDGQKFTAQKIYMIMAALYSSAFFDVDPARSFPLRCAAKAVSAEIAQQIEANVREVKDEKNYRKTSPKDALERHKLHTIHQLVRQGRTAAEITWSYVIPMAIAIIPQHVKSFTEIINFYLSDEGKKHLPEINRTAMMDTPESDIKLLRYCMEALRLCGSVRSLYESQIHLTVHDKSRRLTLSPGVKIFADIKQANRDPSIFCLPDEVLLNRPMGKYINFKLCPISDLHQDTTKIALTTMLRAVGRLKDLRRAPGEQGTLQTIPSASGFPMYVRHSLGSEFPFPTTLKVHFDPTSPSAGLPSVSEVRKKYYPMDSWITRQNKVSSAIKANYDKAFAPPIRKFKARTSSVTMIIISPNHQWLAFDSSDNSIHVWDLEPGAQKWILRDHTLAISSMTFSVDNQRMASASDDNTVRMWNLDTGKTENPILYYTGMATSTCFSSDGRWLASGSYDGSVRLLGMDTETCTSLRSVCEKSRVTSAAFSHDSRYLAIGQFDGAVTIWNIAKDSKVSTWSVDSFPVLSVAFSPSNCWLATVAIDGMVRLWDVHTSVQERAIFCLSLSTSVLFSTDSRKLVTASDTGIVRSWDIQRTSVLHASNHHVDSGTFVTFSPDARQLVSAQDTTVRFWDATAGFVIRTLQLHTSVTSVAFSPCGKHISYAFDDGTVVIWDTVLDRELQTLEAHDLCVSSVTFSSDGRLLSASYDGTVRLWAAEIYTPLKTLTGHMDSVTSAAFQSNGIHAITASSDSTIRSWDVNSGERLWVLECHSNAVIALAHAPNGRWLAASLDNGQVRVWNLITKAELPTIADDVSSVKSIAFSPNSKQVAFGLLNGTVRIWDIESEAEMQALLGHNSPVTSVQFSPNSERLVSASEDGAVNIWEVGIDTECLGDHQTSSAVVASLSPNGELYVAAASGQEVNLWKMRL